MYVKAERNSGVGSTVVGCLLPSAAEAKPRDMSGKANLDHES